MRRTSGDERSRPPSRPCTGAAWAWLGAGALSATSASTGTVSPSLTWIAASVPAAGDGISASTLSVEISNNGSSRSTWSPILRVQRTTVPSVTDSPIWGMTTLTGMGLGSRLVGPDLAIRRGRSSRVNRGAVGGVGGLEHGLGHGRMGVNGADQLLDRALQPQRQRGLGHQLGGPRPDHVEAEHFVVLLLGDDLDEAVGLVGHAGAAEDTEGELPHRDVVALLAGRL